MLVSIIVKGSAEPFANICCRLPTLQKRRSVQIRTCLVGGQKSSACKDLVRLHTLTNHQCKLEGEGSLTSGPQIKARG
jgi:hypothetical protein